MEGNKNQITTLLTSQNSSEAIRRLYDQRKAENPKFSYGKLCQLSGLPSAGLLSDVMSGRRALPEKHIDGICRAFALDGLLADYLRTLIALDDADSEVQRTKLHGQQDSLRKLLFFKKVERPETWSVIEFFKGMEVYTSLPLFAGNATLSEVCAYFHRDDPAWIEKILESLVEAGFIEKRDGVYDAKDNIYFQLGSNPSLFADYVRYCCQDAAHKVTTHSIDRSNSFFESLVFTTEKRRMQELIDEVRKKMLEVACRMETNEGDTVIRFNIQLYPTQ